MLKLNDIGKRIKLLREEAKLTQRHVSEYLSMDQSNLSKIEGGTRSMNADDIEKLAKLFCCPIEYILYGDNRYLECEVSFRAANLDNDDLKALAIVNTIVMNQFEMDRMLGDSDD